MRKGITKGKKINLSHQSVIKSAIPVIVELKRLESINKIIIGPIKKTKSKVAKIITYPTPSAVRLTVKGRGELQEFYLMGSNIDHINQQAQQLSL